MIVSSARVFGAPISWTDTMSVTMTTEGSDYNGYTVRQVYSGAMLSTSGSLVRLELQSGLSNDAVIDGLYIGEQAVSGDAYDMKASAPAPTQFLVSGSGSFTVPAGVTVHTDALTFAFDETKTYVIAVQFNGSSTLAVAGGTSVDAFYKAAASEAANANVSGYTPRPAGQAMLISKIQVA